MLKAPQWAQETPTIEVDQLAALGDMAKGGKARGHWGTGALGHNGSGSSVIWYVGYGYDGYK